jgi:hypothetical protein
VIVERGANGHGVLRFAQDDRVKRDGWLTGLRRAGEEHSGAKAPLSSLWRGPEGPLFHGGRSAWVLRFAQNDRGRQRGQATLDIPRLASREGMRSWAWCINKSAERIPCDSRKGANGHGALRFAQNDKVRERGSG